MKPIAPAAAPEPTLGWQIRWLEKGGRVQFRILGPLEVTVDGARLPLGGRRQRSVLARLLISPGKAVSTDTLIDDIWGDQAPATATKTLQKYVSELRKVLHAAGPPALHRTPGGYVIAVGSGGLDARLFEQLAETAMSHRADGEFAAAVSALRRALALWRGPVLADLLDAPFAVAERVRLEELRLGVIEERFDLELALGRHRAVVGDLTHLVDEHQLREGLWGLLILALYRCGRQADALRTFQRVRRVLGDELGLEPSANLKALEAAVLACDPALDAPPTPRAAGNAPVPLTSFVGRDVATGQVREALVTHRVVTVTGAAGAGKTRLAVELATSMADRYEGGAWFVDLAPIAEPELVVRAVASTITVAPQANEDVLDVLCGALACRPPTLVVLDNCEHLTDACAAVVDAICRRCAGTRILATSREHLGLDGECIHQLGPLDPAAATRLFVDRARLAMPAFELDEQSHVAVTAICRHLDGMPLAIELAASQVRVLEPYQILERLDDRFALLERPRAGTARHGTLRAAVEWSYGLLSPAARSLFARLGVLPGPFPLECAERVCSGGPIARGDVLRLTTELVDKSMLVRELAGTGPAAYRLLETLRVYAEERLALAGETDAVRRRQAEFFIDAAEAAGREAWGPNERACRARIKRDEPNVRAALSWAEAADPVVALRLGVAMWMVWYLQDAEREAVAYLQDALALADDAPDDLRAKALAVSADLAADHGEARNSIAWAQEALRLFRRCGDEHGEAVAQTALGSALRNRGDLERARTMFVRALRTFEDRHDELMAARVLHLLGQAETQRGDYEGAERVYLKSLDAWGRIGTTLGRGKALWMLGTVARYQGDHERAVQLCEQSVACFTEVDERFSLAHVRLTLGDVARLRGDSESAKQTYRQTLDELRAMGDRRCVASTLKNLAVIAAAEGDEPMAAGLFVSCMDIRHELGDNGGLAECLEGLAMMSRRRGNAVEAVELFAAAHHMRKSYGVLASVPERAVVDVEMANARSALAKDEFTRVWHFGQAITPDAAVIRCRTTARTLAACRDPRSHSKEGHPP